jgi:mannose-6-phosphate isomerase-like protein (cupin superfamily)
MVFFQTHGLTNPTTFLYHDVKDLQFPPHFHAAYECLIVHEGVLEVDVNKTIYTVNENQLIFIVLGREDTFLKCVSTRWVMNRLF